MTANNDGRGRDDWWADVTQDEEDQTRDYGWGWRNETQSRFQRQDESITDITNEGFLIRNAEDVGDLRRSSCWVYWYWVTGVCRPIWHVN